MQKLNLKNGFTLIELLVVIAIIGILTGIVLLSITGVRNVAYDSEIKHEISQIRSQAEMHYSTNNTYTGFSVPTAFTRPTCSTQGYTANISTDGSRIAIYADLCAQDNSFWCVDSAGAAKVTTSTPATNSGICP